MKRNKIDFVKLRPDYKICKTASPIKADQRGVQVTAKVDEQLVEKLSKKPPTDFGVLFHNKKALDMDRLAKRILKKGSQEFEKPVMALLGEVAPGHENGVLLTHNQICRMFDVTGMTIYQWRKRYNLPVVVLSGGRRPPVRYDEGVVKAWAQLHGKKIMKHDYLEWC